MWTNYPARPQDVPAAIARAHHEALTGAGADDESSWAALADLAERLGAPVWQEPFGSRAGFPRTTRRSPVAFPLGGPVPVQRWPVTTSCS